MKDFLEKCANSLSFTHEKKCESSHFFIFRRRPSLGHIRKHGPKDRFRHIGKLVRIGSEDLRIRTYIMSALVNILQRFGGAPPVAKNQPVGKN